MTTRILIADDDASIRRLVRRILEDHPNWEVCGEAVDGQEAVVKTVELHPDVVILDLAMPEKNGFQAAREISALFPLMPMVLLPSAFMPRLPTRALRFDISHYSPLTR